MTDSTIHYAASVIRMLHCVVYDRVPVEVFKVEIFDQVMELLPKSDYCLD